MSAALGKLAAMGACSGALEWVKAQGEAAPQELWDRCPNGEWLAWVVSGRSPARLKTLTGVALARGMAAHLLKRGGAAYLDVAEAWAHGRVTEAELWVARAVCAGDYSAPGGAERYAQACALTVNSPMQCVEYAIVAMRPLPDREALELAASIIRRVVPQVPEL